MPLYKNFFFFAVIVKLIFGLKLLFIAQISTDQVLNSVTKISTKKLLQVTIKKKFKIGSLVISFAYYQFLN